MLFDGYTKKHGDNYSQYLIVYNKNTLSNTHIHSSWSPHFHSKHGIITTPKRFCDIERRHFYEKIRS